MSVSPPDSAAGDRGIPPELIRAALEARQALESPPPIAPLLRGQSHAQKTKARYDLARDALREAVTDYANALRDNAVPPEKMVVAVKSSTVEFLPYVSDHAVRLAVVHEIVLWAIQSYFAAA
jgi:hypothetical protein